MSKREDRKIHQDLDQHAALMRRYMANGIERAEASRRAFKDVAESAKRVLAAIKRSDNDGKAISHGVMTLKADADACELPNDAEIQQRLNRAAEILETHDELVAALRTLLESNDGFGRTRPEDVEAARTVLAKVMP